MADPTPADPSASQPVSRMPLSDRGSPAASLPAPLSSFVGREREVEHVANLLRRGDVRLLTLTGPGGVGKTRLALTVVAETGEMFADGVWFVGLGPIHDPDLVAPTIGQALGVREGSSDDQLVDRLALVLRDKSFLLLLDNFEQVVAAAPVVTALLSACSGLTILITSRMRLRVSGEHEHPVPPLDVAAPGVPTVEDAVQSEAVRLFTARARALKEDFVLTSETIPTVAEICRRLDGLPLAIELAVARLKVVPLPTLLMRLERRLPLLTGGGRDQPVRLQTMRDAITWSHDLLTSEEQTLFRRLSVFVSGWTQDAAEAVCGPSPDLNVFDGLLSLRDKSLIESYPETAGEPRFAMLETIREYGLEKLAASGEEAVVRHAHAAYYLSLAERAERGSWDLSEQMRWLDLLEGEIANLRGALVWLEHTGDTEATLRLAGALGGLWTNRIVPSAEGRAWLTRALAKAGEAPTAARATALRALGTLRMGLDDDESEELIAESLDIWRQLGDSWREADALGALGMVLANSGDHDRAPPVLQEAATRLARLGDHLGAANARMHLGVAALDCGDTPRAEVILEEVLTRFRRSGSVWGVGSTLQALGQVAEVRGDLPAAASRHAENLALWDDDHALERLPDTLAGIARLAAAAGEPVPATRLLAAVATLSEVHGYVARSGERARGQRAAAVARAALGEDRFTDAWAAGRTLPPEQAAAEAQSFLASLVPASPPAASSNLAAEHGLTPRELEVLRLLVDGRSDREIADALAITYRTVTTYVGNILNKLGVDSRTAAATQALRRGLV